MSADAYAIVLTACSETIAGRIARSLVEQGLAACVQSLPIDSVYMWKGTVEEARERLLLVKIKSADYAEVERAILALHDYETPEIIALPVAQGFRGYLDWIDAVTQRGPDR